MSSTDGRTVIGVDTGGTFTDLVRVRGDGSFDVFKRPSTPPNFAEGIFDVVREAGGRELLSDANHFCHGTTVGTNAMITGSGACVGLITTVGHRDALPMMRVTGRTAGRSEMELKQYSYLDKPKPIVPKDRIAEVQERVAFRGHVVVPLDEASVRQAMRQLVARGAESIAVCLLWSFMNDEHERRIAEIIRDEAPHVHVSLSSQIAPAIHEYERAATTVVNAHVGPVLGAYLERLEEGLTERGLDAPLYVMQSVGGTMRVSDIRRRAANTLGSGPAGGVVAAAFLGAALGHRDVICADVGGTSFDVGLVVDGVPLRQSTSVVNQYTLLVPTIDVVSIGAGGGSIARAEFGRLLVGPESAGADPGPACYGNGGMYPTVTDANVVLGYIDPDYFLGGSIGLSKELAAQAIDEWVAQPLGMTVERAAAGIVEIATHHMSDLVRKMTVERGFDPRDFALYAYGGAGPLHGAAIGREIGAAEALVPLGEAASAFSALGLATSDLVAVATLSDPATAPFDAGAVSARFRLLDAQAAAEVGVTADVKLQRILELRYKGQVHQVDTPVPSGDLTPEDIDRVIDEFERRYELLYGRGSGFRQAGIELETYRVVAVGGIGGTDFYRAFAARGSGNGHGSAEPTPTAWEPIYWWDEHAVTDTAIYNRLSPADVVRGPAVIRLATTTVLVHRGQVAAVEANGTIRITTNEKDAA